MKDALKNAEASSPQDSSGSNEVACRAAFCLASYADSLYRGAQEQISSPKWATAVAIIQDKKRQVTHLSRACSFHIAHAPQSFCSASRTIMISETHP